MPLGDCFNYSCKIYVFLLENSQLFGQRNKKRKVQRRVMNKTEYSITQIISRLDYVSRIFSYHLIFILLWCFMLSRIEELCYLAKYCFAIMTSIKKWSAVSICTSSLAWSPKVSLILFRNQWNSNLRLGFLPDLLDYWT